MMKNCPICGSPLEDGHCIICGYDAFLDDFTSPSSGDVAPIRHEEKVFSTTRSTRLSPWTSLTGNRAFYLTRFFHEKSGPGAA